MSRSADGVPCIQNTDPDAHGFKQIKSYSEIIVS
jgi:hypothetical protein